MARKDQRLHIFNSFITKCVVLINKSISQKLVLVRRLLKVRWKIIPVIFPKCIDTASPLQYKASSNLKYYALGNFKKGKALRHRGIGDGENIIK